MLLSAMYVNCSLSSNSTEKQAVSNPQHSCHSQQFPFPLDPDIRSGAIPAPVYGFQGTVAIHGRDLDLDGRKKRKKKEGRGAGVLTRWCLFSFFSFFFYFINRHDLSVPASLCLCVFA
jgi:hypothetical protein